MEWSESRCATCPAIQSKPCLAQTSKHSRLCDLANPEHKAYSPHYRAMIAGEKPPAVVAVASEPVPLPESPLAAKLRTINACPHRSDTLKECSCTGRKRCRLGKGEFPSEPWAVTLQDCLRCVGGESAV